MTLAGVSEKFLLDSKAVRFGPICYHAYPRQKKNMDLMIMAQLGYDRKDPINAGVLSYELVGCSAGVSMHRVVYQCPISSQTYRFFTSLTNLPPGLIAYRYKNPMGHRKNLRSSKK